MVSTKIIPSLKILNPAGSGQVIPENPKAAQNQPLSTPQLSTPSVAAGQPIINSTPVTQINTAAPAVSGRMKEMIMPPVNLGSSVGVPPPENIRINTVMPPMFIPGLII